MNPREITPDDARLTAYALGELGPEETALVEAAVKADPALQAIVAETRALADELSTALAHEPAPEVTLDLPVRPAVAAAPRGRTRRARLLQFPTLLLGGLAAAGLAVLVAVRDGESPARKAKEEVRHYELRMPTAAPETADKPDVAPGAEPTPAASETAPRARLRLPPPPADLFKETELATEPASVALDLPPAPMPLASESALELAEREQRAARVEKAEMRQARAISTRYTGASEDAVVSPVPALLRPAPVAAVPTSARLEAKASAPIALSAFSVQSMDTPSRAATVATVAEAAAVPSGFLATARHPRAEVRLGAGFTSYFNLRELLQSGRRPGAEVVRIEEMVNFFPYRFALPPAESGLPVAADVEVTSAPWAPAHRLVRVGLHAQESVSTAPVTVMFVVDTSGSMAAPDRLPLLKDALRHLLTTLRSEDRIGFVSYGGISEQVLPPTPVAAAGKLLQALEELQAVGSAPVRRGLRAAYELVEEHLAPGSTGRVVLCTDGDLDLGLAGDELGQLVQQKSQAGLSLGVVLVGRHENTNQRLAELATAGGGGLSAFAAGGANRRALLERALGPRPAAAEEVAVQLAWDTEGVRAYRLLGYENQPGADAEASGTTDDAGWAPSRLFPGERYTLFYEVVPTESDRPVGAYTGGRRPHLAALALDVRLPGGQRQRVELPVVDRQTPFAAASPDLRFGAAVAGFGLVLKDSPQRGQASLAQVQAWASSAQGDDPGGYRREFIRVVERARELFPDR